MDKRIYLDNNASTPLDPSVLNSLIQDQRHYFGNPSSTHSFGREAKARLTQARDTIAKYLGVRANEIIFTSGATEGLNAILRGLVLSKPGHIISSDVEHSCVYATLKELEKQGCAVTFLKTGLHGAITPQAVSDAITSNTRFVVLMAVNNETGVKTDLQGIAAICQARGIPFIVDAVALLGKEKIELHPGISAMCFSGHKVHAPKGIGFNFIRTQLKFPSLQTGGEQEMMRRGGTENVSGIIALAEAVKLLNHELPQATERMRQLRDFFETEIIKHCPYVTINGAGPRVVNTSNLAFGELDGEGLLMKMDMLGLAASHGSACSSGALEPSRVLLNMGVPLKLARSSIRFSLSRFTTEDEIRQAIQIVLRSLS